MIEKKNIATNLWEIVRWGHFFQGWHTDTLQTWVGQEAKCIPFHLRRSKCESVPFFFPNFRFFLMWISDFFWCEFKIFFLVSCLVTVMGLMEILSYFGKLTVVPAEKFAGLGVVSNTLARYHCTSWFQRF